ncbi:uncharacterized protein LOC115447716 [Manduca sexta]|uniref:uncharacterized protein LOC115447716 n=1 Tax=Manduca sexta TaxID=7130 RepID=UPI00188FB908|nr:uncharacterized protein LOC115447716 [Manduca sexta]
MFKIHKIKLKYTAVKNINFIGPITVVVHCKMFTWLCVLFLFDAGHGQLWPKGVVHYAINTKDYDLHSQDVIMSTLSEIQKEICIKFFQIPLHHNSSVEQKILYINNHDKRKTCPPDNYYFNNSVVDMTVGYKCLNQKDITRIVVDMLKASITKAVLTINSNDLIRKFQAMDEDPNRPTLLTPKDRNFINAHYHSECGALSQRPTIDARRFSGPLQMTIDNEAFYKNKLWPMGIVMYGVENSLHLRPYHTALKYAMTTIELSTCIVFQEIRDSVLKPKNLLWFASEGEETPELGFKEGNQTISLISMTTGAPGHTAHTLNLLLRALGVPMMSNRHDRDNYITVNWKNVQEGKERYLEKLPEAAWLCDQDSGHVPYSFESATHAPANFMCGDCSLTAHTVHPVQDHLWQRTLSMGHRTDLAPCDIETLNILYNKHCQDRYMAKN